MSMWAHVDAKADGEADWDTKWHATNNMMQQILACYKREQLVELERQKGITATGEEAGKAGITSGKGSSSSSSGFVNVGKGGAGLEDIMDFAPPQNFIRAKANQAGSWASRGGWGGSATPRF